MATKTAGTKPFYNYEIPTDWKVKELGQLGKFSKGKGILKEQVIESGLPCIRYGEIYTTHDYRIKEFKSFISEEVAGESKEIAKGDILFAGSGETLEDIGKAVAYLGNEKAYAGGDVIILSTNESNNAEFIAFMLETDFVRRQKRRLGQGQSVVHIYPSDLSTLKLPLPPDDEQEAIADLLHLMDRAINKNNELIAKKELQKKGVMQKLLTSEVRLKGFESSKWREHRLEDLLVKFQNGYAFPATEYSERGIPIITMAQIGLDGTFQFDPIKVNYWEEEKAAGLDNFLLKRGDLITAMTDVTPQKNLIGRMAIINEDGPFLLNQRVGLLRVDTNKIDTTILTALSGMKKWRDYTRSVATLGVQANIGTDDLKKGKIYIPEIQEQKAIAQVLQAADTEIKLLKTKTDKLREKKKGLMQVLLTGKVRLKIK